MKKLIIIVFILSISAFSFSQTVNGDTLTVDGKKILKVWGTHYERGYAYGYLLGEQIRQVAVEYFIESILMNSVILYNYSRNYFLSNFVVEDKYITEAEGMINGMIDSGVDLYCEGLDIELDEIDLLLANSIVDLSALVLLNIDIENEFGCSSLSSWGESTQDDPQLNGDLVITRNMDWEPHPTLLANHLLVVQFPDEENEVKWLSFTFAGMIGALSGINEQGTAVFLNVGNINTYPYEENLHPIFLSLRNGLEVDDYNEDSECDINDIIQAVEDNAHLSGTITHCVKNPDALIIECNNQNGVVTRDSFDNTMIPGDNLVATNHFRSLYTPVYCDRYQKFADSLNVSTQVSIQRNWNITIGAGGVNNNLHTIQYVPTQNIVKWSTARTGEPAYTLEPTIFDLEELFELPTQTDYQLLDKPDFSLISYPNPFNPSIQFEIIFSNEQNQQSEQMQTCQPWLIEIYNVKGQKVKEFLIVSPSPGHTLSITWNGTDENGQSLPTGVYLYQLTAGEYVIAKKMVLCK
jgi:hypothetical protein